MEVKEGSVLRRVADGALLGLLLGTGLGALLLLPIGSESMEGAQMGTFISPAGYVLHHCLGSLSAPSIVAAWAINGFVFGSLFGFALACAAERIKREKAEEAARTRRIE